MAKINEEPAPIQQSIHVDCPVEDAFRLFAERFEEWWPLASYSITGAQAETCAIEPWVGGRVFERTRSGDEREWGLVIAWDPPAHLAFSWHPGTSGDRSQTVDINFQVEADGTRVTLIHTGWQFDGPQACIMQAQYTAQWSCVLELCFYEFAGCQLPVAV